MLRANLFNSSMHNITVADGCKEAYKRETDFLEALNEAFCETVQDGFGSCWPPTSAEQWATNECPEEYFSQYFLTMAHNWFVQTKLAEEGRETKKPSAVKHFQFVAAMLSGESTRVEILPDCPSLGKSSREAEVEFEPRTFRPMIGRQLSAILYCWARWRKWLEGEFTDRKVRGSNPTSASRFPLSRLGLPGSIPALVVPSGGMAVGHQKGITTERFLFYIILLLSIRQRTKKNERNIVLAYNL
ncbi:hypothetical protein CSKR_111696 [Clonorchis sinensis]|uniref:G-protein coupled receptors family 2 profile 1 domain-containing protein n=1 Tax=Clonorchis sinensis TaxID=79923 RepID=A0A3R7JP66_CLOSI|nr:hypothetical protein CSKR_111696 [Clonorchis sinensis]